MARAAIGPAEIGFSETGPTTDLHGHRIAKLRDLDGAEFSVSAP